MKCIIKYHILIVLTVSSIIYLSSCSKSDQETIPEPPSEIIDKSLIVGEWFEDLGGNGVVNFAVMDYKEDGSISFNTVSVEKDVQNCGFYNYSGKYEINGTTLTQWQYHPTYGNTKDDYEIKNLTKYDQVVYNDEFKITEDLHRVVDTYNMIVGETKEISISDNNFISKAFYSNHERVASVDANGIISANEIGTAYISVSSSIGTAVIRVVVTDPANIFIDFSKYLYADIDYIPLVFGDEYVLLDRVDYVGNDADDRFAYYYNLYDDSFLNVIFYYGEKERKVRHVSGQLREEVDIKHVSNFLASKYTYLNTNEEGTEFYGQGIRYMSVVDGQIVYEDKTEIITWTPSERTIVYRLFDKDEE